VRHAKAQRMKRHSQRAQRVGDQIQRELADLIRLQFKDPRIGMVTVTTAGFLRSELSHRLDLYSVPQLHFVYDDSIESGLRLSKLIDDALAEDRKHSS
jgi:ribosome-binding factor A